MLFYHNSEDFTRAALIFPHKFCAGKVAQNESLWAELHTGSQNVLMNSSVCIQQLVFLTAVHLFDLGPQAAELAHDVIISAFDASDA